MREISLDRDWMFHQGMLGPWDVAQGKLGERAVHLPHDYMIETDTFAEAPSGNASGYYNAGVASYTKMIMIPAEWEGDRIFLRFDGAMMNATVEVNGSKAALHHYGYSPFEVDITDLCYAGQENRVTVTLNPSMQPNSRWYSGAGLYRGVTLAHTPPVHISWHGVYGWTESIEYTPDGKAESALLRLEARVRNNTEENRLAEVTFSLTRDGSEEAIVTHKGTIQVPPMSEATAYQMMTVDMPDLWDEDHPNLYRVHAEVRAVATYKTHPVALENPTVDRDSVLFGIRTVQADARHGLRVNGKVTKLRGGCLHHDNGVIGAVTMYDAEYRKLKKMKDAGFNAVRTTHNPPSSALVEACDRLGVYIFDEAFDAWSMGKQPGDYNQFFETDWEKDLTAFVQRDRSHPSVIIWSTGNEITERAGLGNGYDWARKLAETIHALDRSRPVSNGVCSFWNGLDDFAMAEMNRKAREAAASGSMQNVDISGKKDLLWENMTAPYVNALDIVGYNYLEGKYAQDHEIWPDRVILGSENYPNEIGKHWPMIEKTPYVIGDFTWTAWDYIGEAGIGRAKFFDKDDPALKRGPYAMMGLPAVYPWRLANDADFDITGVKLPQGVYRSIVWGSGETGLYSYDPANFGQIEKMSPWGFPAVSPCWSWPGKEGKPVTLAVFSAADEVELILNGKTVAVQKAGERGIPDMPLTFLFDAVYAPGTVEAVSKKDGKEISRAMLKAAGEAAQIAAMPETSVLKADGHSLAYIPVEIQDANGLRVPDAAEKLTVTVEGAGALLGFGSGNPVTDENYTSGCFTTYHGRALAVIRAGCEAGEIKVTIASEHLGKQEITLTAEA
jgi:beta-galactosidase